MSLDAQQKKQLASALTSESVQVNWAALFDKAISSNQATAEQVVKSQSTKETASKRGIIAVHKHLAGELDYAQYTTWGCSALVVASVLSAVFLNLPEPALVGALMTAAACGIVLFLAVPYYYSVMQKYYKSHPRKKRSRKDKKSKHHFDMQVPSPVHFQARIAKDGDAPVVHISKLFPEHVTRRASFTLRDGSVADITEQFDDVLSFIGEQQAKVNKEYYRLLHMHSLDPDSIDMRRQQLVDDLLQQAAEKQLDDKVLKSLNEHALMREEERLQTDASLFTSIEKTLDTEISFEQARSSKNTRTLS